MAAVRFTIGGRVQGVWFRAATREQALALGLQGHANNLADGTVEVLQRIAEGAFGLIHGCSPFQGVREGRRARGARR